MRRLLLVVPCCLASLLGACSAEPSAPALTVVTHSNPMRTTSREHVIWAYNRGTGLWNMLFVFTRGAPAPQNVFAVNQATGTVKAFPMSEEFADKYRPILHLPAYVNAPDGKVHFSVTGLHATFEWTYDPVTNTFSTPTTSIGPHLVGEMHPIVVGTDGNLYFGGGWHERDRSRDTSHNDAVCVVKHDMTTGSYTEYGPIGPRQTVQEVFGIASDGTWIYVADGRMPYSLVAYDTRRAGEPGYTGDVLKTTSTRGGFVGVQQLRYGATCAVSMAGERRVGYWLYGGKAYDRSEHPRPPWSNESSEPASAWTPTPQKPKLDESGLDIVPPDVSGRVTLRYTDASGNWTSANWTVPLYKIPTSLAWPMGNGKLLVMCGAYNGGYIYDPASGDSDWEGTTKELSPYDAAEIAGHMYICGYPAGCLYDYDESRPWTNHNPTLAFTVKDNLRPLQTDALVRCCATPNARLYCVGQSRRAGVAGVLVAYDPATKRLAGLDPPFLTEQTDYVAPVPGSNEIVISAHRVPDLTGAQTKADSGCLFVYDGSRVPDEFAPGAMEHCVVNRIVPVQNSKGAGPIRCVRGPDGQWYAVGWCAEPVSQGRGYADSKTQSRLYRVNLATGQVVQSVLLNINSPWDLRAQHEANGWSLGPDGNIYTFFGRTLVRVHPFDLTRRDVIGTIARGGRIAWLGDRMFLTGESDLREIDGVTEAASTVPR